MITLPSWRRRSKDAPASAPPPVADDGEPVAKKESAPPARAEYNNDNAPSISRSTEATTESEAEVGPVPPAVRRRQRPRGRPPPPPPPPQSNRSMALFPTKTMSSRTWNRSSSRRSDESDTVARNSKSSRHPRSSATTYGGRSRSAPPIHSSRGGSDRNRSSPRQHGKKRESERRRRGEQSDDLDRRERMNRSRSVPSSSKRREPTRHGERPEKEKEPRKARRYQPSESKNRPHSSKREEGGRKSSSNMDQKRSRSTKKPSSSNRERKQSSSSGGGRRDNTGEGGRRSSTRLSSNKPSQHKEHKDPISPIREERGARSKSARPASPRKREEKDAAPDRHKRRSSTRHASNRRDEKRSSRRRDEKHRRARSEDARRTREVPLLSDREHSRSPSPFSTYRRRLLMTDECGKSFYSEKEMLLLTDGRTVSARGRSLSPSCLSSRRRNPLLLTDGHTKGSIPDRMPISRPRSRPPENRRERDGGGDHEREDYPIKPRRSQRARPSNNRSESDRRTDRASRQRGNNLNDRITKDRRRLTGNGGGHMDASTALQSFMKAAHATTARHRERPRDGPRERPKSQGRGGPTTRGGHDEHASFLASLAPRRSKSHDVRPQSRPLRERPISQGMPQDQRRAGAKRPDLPLSRSKTSPTIRCSQGQAKQRPPSHNANSQHGQRLGDARPSDLETNLGESSALPSKSTRRKKSSDNAELPASKLSDMDHSDDQVGMMESDQAMADSEENVIIDVQKVESVVRRLERRASQSKLSHASRSGDPPPNKSPKIFQEVQRNGWNHRDPLVQSGINDGTGNDSLYPTLDTDAAQKPHHPPPYQGATPSTAKSQGSRRSSGTLRPRGVPPPPPPPRRQNQQGGGQTSPPGAPSKNIKSGPPAPVLSPVDNRPDSPGPAPITISEARSQGIKDVANLSYSDRLGGSGLYTGELDQWGRPHGQGTIQYDTGKSFKGNWMHGVPNAVEFQQQNSPHGQQQQAYHQASAHATYAASVSAGASASLAQGGGSLLFAGGHGSVMQPNVAAASPMMFHGAAHQGVARPMYGNPGMQAYGGYNQYTMQRGPMPMAYQCAQGMCAPNMQGLAHYQQPMMNGQAQMMMAQQGMSAHTMNNGYAPAHQQKHQPSCDP